MKVMCCLSPYKLAGLPEASFLDELSVVAPQHARELLRILEAAHVVRVETAAVNSDSGGSSFSVLDSCFALGGMGEVAAGGGSDGVEEEEEEKEARHRRFYFVSPSACFSVPARVVPPQALLPLVPAPFAAA
jgi:hypothetical protein